MKAYSSTFLVVGVGQDEVNVVLTVLQKPQLLGLPVQPDIVFVMKEFVVEGGVECSCSDG
jgi:hypothetical protein